MAVLEEFEPKEVLHFFEELCSIPHGTFDTKRISDYCVGFAKERGLEVIQDEVNNVIIKKPGTAGYENSEPVIIQGHIDMVCEKTPESNHDFSTQGLELYVEDGFLKAKDTTLGGDDGIAVAMAMAILDSKDIPHPPIEAVFTVDEEVGMGGAAAVDLSVLEGKMLLNIDSEEEGVLTTGCAGGFRFNTIIPVERMKKTGALMELKLTGLAGGHSGIEIHKQRGNAHKLMARLLSHLAMDTELFFVEMNGGSKDNVIACESIAEILVAEEAAVKVKEKAEAMIEVWKSEFMGEEPGLSFEVTITEQASVDVCTEESTKRVIAYFVAVPNGVQAFERKIEGTVETSLNLGIVQTAVDTVVAGHLIRSSIESKKQMLKEALQTLAGMVNAETEVESEYPAWQYKADSKLRGIMEDTYEEVFGKKPEVTVIHAGLECGYFLSKKPDLDPVSFGPNIYDIHSFNERLDIASTERCYTFLKKILEKCK